MRLDAVVLTISSCLLLACSVNPHYDSNKEHHTPQGFKNIYYDDDQKGLWAFLKWKWQQLFEELPQEHDYQFEIDRSQHHLLKHNQHQTSLTWIGHATFLLQFRGMNILTDPQFSERASPLSWYGPKRVVPAAMQIRDLPDIDVVIISHNHYDSLDVYSITQLAQHNQQRQIHFLVPLGLKQWIDNLGFDNIQVSELDWHESYRLDQLELTAEPVQHWSKRSLFDTMETLWCSWVIEAGDRRIFFAGDTGYAPHFRAIGEKYGRFDLAMLPIGAYEPRWFMKPYHVNPQEAVQIHRDIYSNYSVAMHWGTFILTDEPLDEPPEVLAKALNASGVDARQFEVYQHGETRFLDF